MLYWSPSEHINDKIKILEDITAEIFPEFDDTQNST